MKLSDVVQSLIVIFVSFSGVSFAQDASADPRNSKLQNLNGYFPFKPVSSLDQWNERKLEIQQRILVSQGLWPLPTRTELNATIHGRIERDDYSVERVYFESAPGHFVTGSLYRPKKRGSVPAILSPHGHWNQGRFYDAGEKLIEQEVQSGAEQDEVGGRFPLQARAVQLARMGCIVFLYDMTGNADSIQIEHRPTRWSHLDRPRDWGFMSVQADLRLQNMMGLQTWNSIRSLDFLCELPDVDQNRIGITGASGGGTQTMILAAIDDRLAASMPCVMVSTAMQGGCTCENAPLLRINQGNIDIAAAFAPKPLALTAADDWTVELRQKGFPDLLNLYEMCGQPGNLTGVFRTEFKHNYNLINRTAMYQFFNRHFQLGFEEPIAEAYYEPLTRAEATVWSGQHAAPKGDQVGDSHEVSLLRLATEDSRQQMQDLLAASSDLEKRFRKVVGTGWKVILGRTLAGVGPVAEEMLESSSNQESSQIGRLTREANQEQVRIQKWSTTGTERGSVVLLTDQGLIDFSSDANHPVQSIKDDLVKNQFEVISCDWFTSNITADGKQPMWYQPSGDQGWKRFSGYTYGYNHCLFVKRVHDLQTVIQSLRQQSHKPIHLVGIGSIAGPIALAARSQMGDSVEKTFVDLANFDFEKVTNHGDAMFVPGAVKYLGLDGLLALCAPNHVARLTSSEVPFPAAEILYRQSNSQDRLKTFDDIGQITQYLLSP